MRQLKLKILTVFFDLQKGGFDLTENNFIIELIARLNKLGSKKTNSDRC